MVKQYKQGTQRHHSSPMMHSPFFQCHSPGGRTAATESRHYASHSGCYSSVVVKT